MKSFAHYLKEESKKPKVTLWTNPKHLGADVNDEDFSHIEPSNIPVDDVVGLEPEQKMEIPSSKKNMEQIASSIKKGEKIKPILVRKHGKGFQILDGHHRYHAHRMAGSSHISARVVPDEDIEVRDDIPES